MKQAFVLALIMCVAAAAEDVKAHESQAAEVVHLATALDHLTVLEFGEPVTMAAAGSSAFQIERHEDKVFVKPLKPGASTDLFVWTRSRRFTYELESPGEVRNMNFAIDNRVPAPKPVQESSAKLEDVADMMLTRTFLDSERVDSASISDAKHRVMVRIENVFQSKNTLYIHYSIRNNSSSLYQVNAPIISQALAPKAKISVASLDHMQLDGQLLRKLGELKKSPMIPTRAETRNESIRPGEETQGIVAIRTQFSRPTIFQLIFGPAGSQSVQATVVL